MTSEGTAHGRFQRAIRDRHLRRRQWPHANSATQPRRRPRTDLPLGKLAMTVGLGQRRDGWDASCRIAGHDDRRSRVGRGRDPRVSRPGIPIGRRDPTSTRLNPDSSSGSSSSLCSSGFSSSASGSTCDGCTSGASPESPDEKLVFYCPECASESSKETDGLSLSGPYPGNLSDAPRPYDSSYSGLTLRSQSRGGRPRFPPQATPSATLL